MQSHVCSYICAIGNRRVQSLLEETYLDSLTSSQLLLQESFQVNDRATRIIENFTSLFSTKSSEQVASKNLKSLFEQFNLGFLAAGRSADQKRDLRGRVRLLNKANDCSKLYETFELSRYGSAKANKKPPTADLGKGGNHYTLSKKSLPYGKFISLSTSEVADEVGGYFVGLITGLNFAPPLAPTVCKVKKGSAKEEKGGIFTLADGESISAQNQMEGAPEATRQALEEISKQTIDYLCIYHFLLGSKNAHAGNTMLRFRPKVGESEALEVAEILEVDHRSIMPPSGKQEQVGGSSDDICSMRIWWLGLSNTAQPFTEESLRYILQLNPEDFYCLSDQLRLFKPERVNALIARLTTMKQLARKQLQKRKITLTPQELFRTLNGDHPSISLSKDLFSDPVEAYNQIGVLSTQELQRQLAQQRKAASF